MRTVLIAGIIFVLLAVAVSVSPALSQNTHPITELTDASGNPLRLVRYIGDASADGSSEVSVTFDNTGLDKIFVFLTVQPVDEGTEKEENQAGGKGPLYLKYNGNPDDLNMSPGFNIQAKETVNTPLSGYFVIPIPITGSGMQTVSFPEATHFIERHLVVFGVDKSAAASPVQSHPISEAVKVATPLGASYLVFIGSDTVTGTSTAKVPFEASQYSSAVAYAMVAPKDNAANEEMHLRFIKSSGAIQELGPHFSVKEVSSPKPLNSPLSGAYWVDLNGQSGSVQFQLEQSNYFDNRQLFVFGVPK